MKLMQYMKMAAKSSATVTLGLTTGSAFTSAPPDATAHPIYLRNLAMVITTELATADATFWGCPGYYRVIIERIT